ncbi:hypothetical protein QP162_06500 [Sphingomonas aurantiaca]|uniref:hypothetical protein n=1 Tax=Sphingomonas aurantiaca TaxID=185949 RepID=UPI002FDFA266
MLIAGTLAILASSAISADTSTTNSAGSTSSRWSMIVRIVARVFATPSGTQCITSGVACANRPGVGTGAPIMSGKAAIVIGRSNPSNSDGLAVRIVTARSAGSSRMIAIARFAWPRP